MREMIEMLRETGILVFILLGLQIFANFFFFIKITDIDVKTDLIKEKIEDKE